jgi:hypothetical protein
MDSDTRRSWSGNSNHSTQNHTGIAEQDEISEEKWKEKQWSSNDTEPMVKVWRMNRLGLISILMGCDYFFKLFPSKKIINISRKLA